MNLSDLKPNEGSTHSTRRVGRGIGSGRGKTCGRGTKGNKARDTMRPGFEGGQTPLHRRLPHMRGFTQPFKKEYVLLNLGDLERFDAGTAVTPEMLIEKRVIHEIKDGLRILGSGELTKSLTVRAHHFSKTAQAKIESLGGTVEKIERKRRADAA